MPCSIVNSSFYFYTKSVTGSIKSTNFLNITYNTVGLHTKRVFRFSNAAILLGKLFQNKCHITVDNLYS